ncbi:protein kinase [Haloimpatiens sp. FM7315]|uniref:protein kinase n=1 Tax=Haloimpatiens sp. FM7315 TaxID=3298609 RepID=UPI0035A2D686
MSKIKEYYIDLDEKVECMLKKAKYIGKGHNGIIYMLPDGKIIKIFIDPKVCDDEYFILKKAYKSKYFPKVHSYGKYYIIRDYVKGKRLDSYIKKHGLDRKISSNLIKLIKEFKKLGFTRLDIRCKDLYVQEDLSIMVIDPKNNYSKEVAYPRHLMKGLSKINVLDEFLSVVKEEEPEFYELWDYRIKKYLELDIK